MYSFCVFLLVGRNGSGKSNFFSGNNRNPQKEKHQELFGTEVKSLMNLKYI